MPKTFYTERDIEDLARQGIATLDVDDDIVLTDLAREKALRLGIQLVREHDKPPAAPQTSNSDLHQRVRQAVISRLGDSVDQALLETIITRVLQNINTK